MREPTDEGGTRAAALHRRARLATRAAGFLAAAAALSPFASPTVGRLVAAASPLVGATSALATRSVDWLSLAAVPGLVLAIALPRGFCRWLCPVGLMAELAAGAVGRRPVRPTRWPAVGRVAVLLTLGGAVARRPLLAWLDPLAMFSSAASAAAGRWTPATAIAATGLVTIILVSVLVPGLWCGRLCPLGAGQKLLAAMVGRIRRLTFFRKQPAATSPDEGPHWTRRWLLAAGTGLALGAIARRTGARADPQLRPPGAADASGLPGLCVRCGQCVRACPSHVVQPDLGSTLGLMAPVLRFDEDYCRPDCTACTRACPSGALAPLSPEAKRRWHIGIAEVNLRTCLLATGGECTACLRACPYNAISMAASQDGFTRLPQVEADLCNGCGACQATCPVRPQRAIVVRPIARRRGG